MKLVTREESGLRPPKYRNRGELSDESTAHWNGPTITIKGKTTWDHAYCAGIIRGIQNYHMDAKGWSDIAYNFVPCPHGYIFEGRGLNTLNGANGTNIGNRTSHAIMCLAGGGNPFPETEKVGFRECVSYISNHTKAPDRCKGHRDHKSTDCPGDARYSWVHKGMPINSQAPSPGTYGKKKGDSMEAALLLIKIHYDNARGDGKGGYDVRVKDPKGYQHWVEALLTAYDKGTPLKAVTDSLGGQLYFEMLRREQAK